MKTKSHRMWVTKGVRSDLSLRYSGIVESVATECRGAWSMGPDTPPVWQAPLGAESPPPWSNDVSWGRGARVARMPGCYRRDKGPPRRVPPFSVQSLQRNVIVIPPPKVHLRKPRPYKKTPFRRFYDSNDLPINRENSKSGTLQWKVHTEKWNFSPRWGSTNL